MSITGVNIVDVLSKPTKERPEVQKVVSEVAKEVVNQSDFDPNIKEKIQEQIQVEAPTAIPPVPTVEEEEEEEHDTEQSAEALIDMIDITQKSIFTLWGAKKLKKKIPPEVMAQFEAIDYKDMMGEELTELEQKQLKRYKEYVHRLDRMVAETPFTDEERADLMKCSEAFVKKAGIKIPPSLWFGAQMVSIISKRGINIALT